jgi:hypothetical protein
MTFHRTKVGQLIAEGRRDEAARIVSQALIRAGGNMSLAGRELGTSYIQFRRWCKKLGIGRAFCPQCKQELTGRLTSEHARAMALHRKALKPIIDRSRKGNS